MLIKIDFIIKKWNYKKNAVSISGNCNSKIIFVILRNFKIWDGWLKPEKTNLCRIYYCLKVFYNIFDGS